MLPRKNSPPPAGARANRFWNPSRLYCQALPLAAETGGSANPPVRVLLVDDHEDTNRSLTILLGRRGYKVQTATSLASAEALFQVEKFDVLVCDMNLPDGSGLDLLARLAADPPRLGAIVLSGYNTEEDIERSLAAGYKAHLGKPVDLDKLVAEIKRLGR